MGLMKKFDFKITKNFWSIGLVIAAVCFVIGESQVGGLFICLAVIGYFIQRIIKRLWLSNHTAILLQALRVNSPLDYPQTALTWCSFHLNIEYVANSWLVRDSLL